MTTTPDTKKGKKGQPSVSFTIDGIEYTTDDRRQTAAELLALAGVDPADHDLGRVVGQGNVKKFTDDEEIQITPGERFVTIFAGTTPVV